MKTIVHVNQTVIRQNIRDGTAKPCITVKNYKENVYASHVDIVDKAGTIVASIVYNPQKPLSCGARVWIETEMHVQFKGETAKPSICRKKCLTSKKTMAKN